MGGDYLFRDIDMRYCCWKTNWMFNFVCVTSEITYDDVHGTLNVILYWNSEVCRGNVQVTATGLLQFTSIIQYLFYVCGPEHANVFCYRWSSPI